MKVLTYDSLRRAVKGLGYPFFDRGDYNLNLIGLRTHDNRSELFNDWFFVAFRQNDHEQLMAFQITTDPGVYYRKNPINVDGTAIMIPGHYPSLWSIGSHKGRYQALVQTGPVKVWRDNNRDEAIDLNVPTADRGYFGINLHRANAHRAATTVGKWSAGCQVFANPDDFEFFMALTFRAAEEWGEHFSYTLLTESDFWDHGFQLETRNA